MASDYKKIAEEHKRDYGRKTNHLRFYKRLYNDKTHFVYELIQNADDSKSQHLELQLDTKTLLVWNDGRQFDETDVRNICSIGSSDKDLTQIGNFGIGFKAVYNYTDVPEIYSGDERFRIRDFIKPEGIDEMTPEIARLVNEGKTVFRLPFKDILRQEEEITRLENRLRDLSKERSLLFLRHLERIEWKDERSAQRGSYSCRRYSHDKIQNASEVELTVSLNGSNRSSETFLIFRKEVQPPQDVTNELLYQAEDVEEQQRIQQAATKSQSVEVAFKLQDSRITAMDDNCVLFAYLPTQKETHLKFLIQARYQTTPARDNIPKPSENPWNEWLVTETANFLPEVLEHLKAGGLLEPAFFDVLPVKDEVKNDFKPIVKVLRQAMRERIFVPTEKEGHYAKVENVLYPHDEFLQEFVESSWLQPNSTWLHPDIREEEWSCRRFTVMQEAGMKEIDFRKMLRWCEDQDSGWFENRSKEWLLFFYTYLNKHKSQLERIKKLPLVRLENGRHVCASDELVFFPPRIDEGYEEIKPFLKQLPILKAALLEGDEHNNIVDPFLKSIGVRAPHPEDVIRKWIIPQYFHFDQLSVERNYFHIRYLFKVWNRLSVEQHKNLKGKINETPILRAYNSAQPEIFDFVKPCDVYLPKAYTGNADLETYFSASDGDIWFVDDTYLGNNTNRKDWFQFLKAIGAMDIPRVIEENVSAKSEDDQEFNKELDKRNVKRERTTWGLQTSMKDLNFHGLSEALVEISDHRKINLSHVLWGLLIKMVKPLPSGEWNRQTFFDNHFRGIYRWYFRKNRSKSFDATFYRQLKETAWIPDKHGNLHTPSECFASTDGNRRVLGESVAYLHPDFDISQDNEAARWLAEKLGIHLNANTDSVLNYLQTLSGTEVGVEKVEPLYRFLERQDARRSEEFKQKPLIFTSNPEPNWWRSDEVFWDDQSVVFGNHRGYLKKNYTGYEGTLEPFFSALGVLRNAALSDYLRVIREVTSIEQADDPKVRARVETLYRHIMPYLQEGDNSMENEEWKKEWDITRKGRCWLGKKGNEWGFFFLHELVWKDDDYRSRLFKNEIPFWVFDNDLLEFAKCLNIKGCYQSSEVKFDCYGDQGEYKTWSEKVQNLYPYIYDFLNSPRLCEQYRGEQAAEILKRLSVHRAQRLEVRYRLNAASVPDPNPRQSFLEKKKGILWLGLEEDEEAYPDLIGDALQDDFRIDQLREFVKDLLPSVNLFKTALLSWKRRGFQPNRCLLPPKSDSKEDEENSSNSVDEKFPCETGAKSDSETNNSESETPTVHEDPETGNQNDDSTENGFETATYQPHTGMDGTRPSEGKAINTPNRNRGTDHSSRHSSGRKDDTHMDETDTSPHARKEVEDAGMKYAHCYEKKKKRTPEDVSSENRGYDIYSTSPDGKNRCIEVKARAKRALVVLTSNEWKTAEQLKDSYFLYVVLNAETQPELYIIQNPADKVAVDERYEVRYQVPLSEIEEHGKLV